LFQLILKYFHKKIIAIKVLSAHHSSIGYCIFRLHFSSGSQKTHSVISPAVP